MNIDENIARDRNGGCFRAINQLGPVPHRYAGPSTHLRCCGVLDVDDLGYRTGAAKGDEDVVNGSHVDIYNMLRVGMST